MSKFFRAVLAISVVAAAFAVHPASASTKPTLPTPSLGSEYFTASHGHLTYHGPSKPRLTFGQQMELARQGKQTPRDALRNLQRQSLLPTQGQGQAAAASSTPAGPPSSGTLIPVGDLNRDGGNDVVRVSTYRASKAVVTAYQGVDGTVLWTHTETNSGYTSAFPFRVGQSATNGVLVVTYSCTLCSAADQVSLSFTALRGDGTTAWTRVFTGEVANALVAGASYQAPTFSGLLDSTRAVPTSILVSSYTWVAAAVAVESFDGIVISGVDGSTLSTMSTGPLANTDNYLLPAGAVGGNGHDDYVDLQYTNSPVILGSLSLIAVSSSDGHQLWTTPASDWFGGVVLNAGDTTGSGHDDVLLTNPPYYIGGQGFLRSILLNGATGQKLWDLPLDLARPIGDIDGDGHADIGAQSVLYNNTTLGARYDAVDGNGTSIYSTPYAVTSAGSWVGSLQLLPDAGDVNGDGHSAAGHDVAMADFDTDTMVLDRGVVSGTTGAKLWSGQIGLAAGGPLAGSGSDLIKLAWANANQDAIAVTAIHGATGATLWQQNVQINPYQYLYSWSTSDVDGDGGADLFLSFDGSGPSSVVLRGSDGSELTYNSSATGGPSTTVETKSYSLANGAVVWSNPATLTCDPSATSGYGGTCFSLRGAGSFSLAINDMGGQPVTGNYTIFDGGGSALSGGSFCGSIANIPTTVDASQVYVWIGPFDDAPVPGFNYGQPTCNPPAVATSGTVTATVTA